jgi:hypothetical protein
VSVFFLQEHEAILRWRWIRIASATPPGSILPLPRTIKGICGCSSCRYSAFHHSTRSRPGDVRQRQTRPAIAARVVGPPRRFHKHNNPAHMPPALFSLNRYLKRLYSPNNLIVHHVKLSSSSQAVRQLRCLHAVANNYEVCLSLPVEDTTRLTHICKSRYV